MGKSNQIAQLCALEERSLGAAKANATRKAKNREAKALRDVKGSRDKLILAEGTKKKARTKEKDLSALSAADKLVKKKYSTLLTADYTQSNRLLLETLDDVSEHQGLPKVRPKYKRHRNSVLRFGMGSDESRAAKFSKEGRAHFLLNMRGRFSKLQPKAIKKQQTSELKMKKTRGARSKEEEGGRERRVLEEETGIGEIVYVRRFRSIGHTESKQGAAKQKAR
jgi:hypothetical protein